MGVFPLELKKFNDKYEMPNLKKSTFIPDESD